MLEDKDLRSLQEVRQKVQAAYDAFLKYRDYSQEQVDAIVDRVAQVARENAVSLAELAVEETGYGNVRDKIAKNLLNSDTLHRYIRPLKTAGIIREDDKAGLIEVAEPMGVVAAILPTTNPTSTAFYKILIALKSRNTIVISPHPRARRCTCQAAALLAQAAVEAGAPEGVVQCVNEATIEGTNELMRHRRTGIILSTGGSGIVRAAYSSGKPALGVGPGNVPVMIDSTANIEDAIRQVVDGKSFDFGTVCSSEQTIVVEERHREEVWRALKSYGAYICDAEQGRALEKLLITPTFGINADCVGQSPQKIAKMAGFSIPESERILAVEIQGVGREHPMSAEKLSPVLSVLFVPSFEAGIEACAGILNFGGRGHTCVIFSTSRENVKKYGLRMPAFRVLVNTPSPQGSTGITTNVAPSMTLGCGAMAGNSTSDNVSPLHLINIKRIAFKVREPEEAFTSPEAQAYFRGESVPKAKPAPAAASPVSRPDITAAVDRYLARKGAAAPAPAPSSMANKMSARDAATQAVDRFLAGRSTIVAPAANLHACACSAPGAPAEPAAPAPTPAKPEAKPTAPALQVVDFVSEDDARRARTLGKKIYVNRKTIVTPAARDLDADGAILVMTE
jgi:acetaldehyde dehydrogenase (acetylating)